MHDVDPDEVLTRAPEPLPNRPSAPAPRELFDCDHAWRAVIVCDACGLGLEEWT